MIIENDVNLAALAERSVGAARGLEDFVLVWIGGGLAMAAFLGGKVHRGAAGAAGEMPSAPRCRPPTEPTSARAQTRASRSVRPRA